LLPLSRRIASGQAEPPPADWAEAFGRPAPLEVDLGSGRGAYALERARREPGLNVLALEARHKWVQLIRRLAERDRLGNIRALACDIQQDLGALLAPGSVQGFTILHPDPWWKKRHHKRRLVRPSMVALLGDLLAPGGFVFLQTDVPQLADEAAEAFGAARSLEPMDPEAWFVERLGGVLSHRGQRCRKLGIPVRRLAYRKRPGARP
jgi:tRNA (guanine-N7-)-methyltransferase